MKEDPANNPADIVVTILVELTSSTPTSATYGPDPNFDPVLGTSRWWWRLGLCQRPAPPEGVMFKRDRWPAVVLTSAHYSETGEGALRSMPPSTLPRAPRTPVHR